jgi:hypothetical protein
VAEHDRARQQRDRLVEALASDLDHRRRISLRARVVEHDVELPELAHGPVDNGGDVGLARDVGMDVDERAPVLLLERGTLFVVDVGGDDLCALGDEELSAAATDAARRARDHRDLALQPICHGSCPFVRPPLIVRQSAGRRGRLWQTHPERPASINETPPFPLPTSLGPQKAVRLWPPGTRALQIDQR